MQRVVSEPFRKEMATGREIDSLQLQRSRIIGADGDRRKPSLQPSLHRASLGRIDQRTRKLQTFSRQVVMLGMLADCAGKKGAGRYGKYASSKMVSSRGLTMTGPIPAGSRAVPPVPSGDSAGSPCRRMAPWRTVTR